MSPHQEGVMRDLVVNIMPFMLLLLKPSVTCGTLVDGESVLWNAALCKPAYQKDTYQVQVATANLGVDGNRDGRFDKGSCFHTNGYYNNWWFVDLMEEFLVQQVVITNRADGVYDQRLFDVDIDLFESDPRLDSSFPHNTNGVRCNHVTTAYVGSKSFDCTTPIYARYVKLLKTAVSYFHACEIEVMVSRKRDETDSRKTAYRYFNTFKDSFIQNVGGIVEMKIISSVQECIQVCMLRRDVCNGIYWTANNGTCQILTLNPFDLGDVSGSIGTDSYVESPIRCTGNGTWVYE